MPVEYLDPSIANEGIHVDKWNPGNWADAPPGDEEWQPDIDPPPINDYAAFKKHKHYGKYFRPYRYTPFPAWMYHATQEPKLVKSREDVLALGPQWSPTPNKPRIDMTGKSLPVKSETQRLAEVVAQALAVKTTGSSGGIDATAIAAVVAAVMAALPQNQVAVGAAALPESRVPPDAEGMEYVEHPDDTAGAGGLRSFLETPASPDADLAGHGSVERNALIELAEKEGIKIDKRWSNDRIKKELGL